MPSGYWYPDKQKSVLGFYLRDAIRDGWWDDAIICCIDCHAPAIAYYDYNTNGNGHDWLYCQTHHDRNPNGNNYGSQAVKYLRKDYEKPKSIELRVIVKGQQ
jgi:hypothetical protein